MNRLPPPHGDYEVSQKDGNVGISVGNDDLPEEFPSEDRIVPPKTSSRATDGFGDQDTRQVAYRTNPTRANIHLNAGNLTDEKKSKEAASNRMPEFADEFPSEDPVLVLPSAPMPEGKRPRLGARKLSPLEHQQPVEGSASYPRSSIIDGTNQRISAVPGAFLMPATANRSNLDTPYGIAADNQAESEGRVVLGDNLRSTPPGSGFLFLEAEAVQEYDVVEAQRVNSVVVSNETQRPLKWHQKTFYRLIVIGSTFLVGVIIVVVVLVTNSKKQQQATVQGPASLTPSPPSPTQGPTAEPSTLEQMQIACDFLDVSLNTCLTLTTFGSAVVGTSIPSEIALLTQLTKLVIENRDLGGSIPSSLGTMTQLVDLFLEGNQFTGIIPSSLGSLTLLTNLSLAKNGLAGTIPSSIASLTKLLNLYLYDNNLTGSIFSTIGNLTKLQRLSFSNNLLVGEVPGSFGSMAQLVRLDLNNNDLTGSLPVTFASLAKLTELRIFNNSMSSINFPSNLCSTGSSLYFVDCQDLGEICSCCTNYVFNSNSCS